MTHNLQYAQARHWLPYHQNNIHKAKALRRNMTGAESKLWFEVLRNRQFLDFRFLRQRTIDRFIVDFYCAELKLAIEIDGDSHAETADADCARTRLLGHYGIQVIRYTNQDVLNNLTGVYDDLVRKVQRLIPPTPLKKGG